MCYFQTQVFENEKKIDIKYWWMYNYYIRKFTEWWMTNFVNRNNKKKTKNKVCVLREIFVNLQFQRRLSVPLSYLNFINL